MRRLPRSYAVALGVLAAALLLAHWSAASLQGIFFFEDFKHYTARMAFTGARLRAGEWPLWNPYVSFGAPHLPAWYLPNAFLFAFLPLTVAVNYAPLLHLFWGAAGIFFLARAWGQSTAGATLAGLVYALGGFASAGLEYLDIVVAISWYPWVLLCTDRALHTGSRKAVALGAVALGLQISGGHSQMVLFGAGLTCLYAGALWLAPRGPVTGARVVRVLLPLFLVGAGLAGAFLATFLELMTVTGRSAGIGLNKAVSFSLPPNELAGLLLPFLRDPESLADPWVNGYGAHSIFVGVLPLALVPFAMRGIDLRRAFLGMLVVLAVLMSLGQYGPFYPLLYTIPPLSWVRVPIRLLWVENFAAALLAGFGLDQLLDRGLGRVRLIAASVLALLAAAVLWAPGVLAGAPLDPGTRPLPFVLSALAAAAVLLLPDLPRAPSWLLPTAAVGVATAELVAFNGSLLINRVVPADVYDLASATASRLHALDASARIYQTGGQGDTILAQRRADISQARLSAALLSGTLPAQFRVRSCVGQLVAPPPGLLRFRRRVDRDPGLLQDDLAGYLGRLGVRFVLSAEPLTGHALRSLDDDDRVRTYENTRAFSRAVFTCPTTSATPMWTLTSPAPLGLVAAGEEETCSGTASIAFDEPERVVVSARSPSAGYVLLADADYPGWVATVNGRRVAISTVDGLVRAVPVPPGDTRVEFVYRPASALWGVAVSLASVLIVAFVLRAKPSGT